MSAVSSQLYANALTAANAGDEEGAIGALQQMTCLRGCDVDSAVSAVKLARGLDENRLALDCLSFLPDSHQTRIFDLQLRRELGESTHEGYLALLKDSKFSDLSIVVSYIGALVDELGVDAGISELSKVIASQPEWHEGRRLLTQLLWQAGDAENWHRPMREFVDAVPADPTRWAMLLGLLQSAEQWDGVNSTLLEARAMAGGDVLLDMVSADCLSGCGQYEKADQIFARLGSVIQSNADFALAWLRHLFRTNRLSQAAIEAEKLVAHTGKLEAWAWLGSAWLLTDNAKSEWLFRGEELVDFVPVNLSATDLLELAVVVRNLHSGESHPLGQSPRGGTQTMTPLFKRAEAPIRKLRQAVRASVKNYIDNLPATDASHPFLGRDRKAFRFEGAWSVKLRPHGRHMPHIHSHGWISSACYVDIPEQVTRSDKKEGWLQLGVPLFPDPPVSDPIMTIAPKAGYLALFPSIMWHGTLPFGEGERLTAAFDVVSR